MSARLFKKFVIAYSLLIVGVLTMGPAYAQTPPVQPAQSNVLKPKEKKQNLSFEDELVEGNTQKPELFYLFQKKNFNYKRLIRLRENFLPEMRKTAEEIQRTRGIN